MMLVGYDYCSKESHVVGHLSTSKRSNPTPETKKKGGGRGEVGGKKTETKGLLGSMESPFGAWGDGCSTYQPHELALLVS
jgi:hypothetical protein